MNRPRAAGAVPESVRVRIATWNIHGCVGTDRRLDPARVGDVLAEIDADVVGLQEVDWRHPPTEGLDQLSYLARRLGAKPIAGPNLRDHRGEYGNGLLSQLPLVGFEPLDLSVGTHEPRGAIDATLRLAGRPLRVIVTHLGLGRRERSSQVASLRASVSASEPGAPVVLVGDFNEWRPGVRGVPRLSPEPFGFSSRGRSFPSRLPVLALDRILARPMPDRARTWTVRSAAARRASDHLPVVAELEWDEPAEVEL